MPEKKVKYSEIIADRLSKSGWSWGCVAVVNDEGSQIFVVDGSCSIGSWSDRRVTSTTGMALLEAYGLNALTREKGCSAYGDRTRFALFAALR